MVIQVSSLAREIFVTPVIFSPAEWLKPVKMFYIPKETESSNKGTSLQDGKINWLEVGGRVCGV